MTAFLFQSSVSCIRPLIFTTTSNSMHLHSSSMLNDIQSMPQSIVLYHTNNIINHNFCKKFQTLHRMERRLGLCHPIHIVALLQCQAAPSSVFVPEKEIDFVEAHDTHHSIHSIASSDGIPSFWMQFHCRRFFHSFLYFDFAQHTLSHTVVLSMWLCDAAASFNCHWIYTEYFIVIILDTLGEREGQT